MPNHLSRIDALNLDPPRVLAALMIYLGSTTFCALDARLLSKRRNVAYGLGMSLVCCCAWTLIFMWYSGHWLQVFQRTIQLDNNRIDLMSTSMSFFTTATVLLTRFAWTMAVSKEINQFCMLHGTVAYRVRQGVV